MNSVDHLTCPIHQQSLKTGLALIRYGLIRFSEAYRTARDEQFQNSCFYTMGGCGLGTRLVQQVQYCDQCRNAHLMWCQTYTSSEGLPPARTAMLGILQHGMGMQPEITITPPDLPILLANGQLVEAAKRIREANPHVDFGTILIHLNFLNRHTELDELMAQVESGVLVTLSDS
ncbi:hypothetical protein [Chitinivorax sp. B]|uniref:hypothetical protein n=1 Tax=Chitinivorax sp. B TaxID=2502235 RepID=UPI0010F72F24|nr:hypothetical protein [Chitinivorax sp. B]